MNDNIGAYFSCNGILYNVEKCPFPFEVGQLVTGDLYEVLRAIDGKLLFYQDHIQRLRKSILLSGIDYKINDSILKKDLIELVKANGYENCNIKIVLTRNDNNYYLYAYLSKFSYPEEFVYIDGVRVDYLKIERNNPNIKAINENYKKAVAEAIQEKGLFEVLLVNRDNCITEGSRTNVFAIKGENVYTAPANMVLEGITRKYVFQACEKAGVKVTERALTVDEMTSCEGVFLSGTSIKTLPVREIGNMKFDTGKNKIFQNILNEFNNILYKNLDS